MSGLNRPVAPIDAAPIDAAPSAVPRPSRSLVARTRRGVVACVSAGLIVGALGSFGGSPAIAAPAVRQAPLPQGAPRLLNISVGLRQGAVGPQVKSLQEALIATGIRLRGGADGIFGTSTRAAVMSYQSARALAATGEVDAPTLAALSGAPPAAPAASAGTPGELALGASGDAVKELQQALVAAGAFVPGGADGVFGKGTQTAVKNFQRWNGLEVTGSVNAATAAKLKLTGTPVAAPIAASEPAPAAVPAVTTNPYVGLTMGAQGALVKALQQALINAGSAVRGGADGSFGAATKTALTSYQSANGLTASGSVDEATATKLGLGALAPAPVAANQYVGLKIGAQGALVKDLQRALLQTGLVLRGGADGSFGAATKVALISFQKVNGTEQTGVVGTMDASVLGLGSAGPTQPQGMAGTVGYPSFGERGDRVKALQQSLIDAGIKVPGGADGQFGSGTAGAIMEYQRREGLPVTGKIDDQTAGKLGHTAAPAPAAPSAEGVTLTAFPVQGRCWYGDTWHAPRGAGRLHEGVDLIAAEGLQLYAVVDGTISKQYVDFVGSTAGNGLRVAQDNGTYFTYLHLSAFAEGIAVGTRVTAGQLIGYVGQTGSAATPHLHFEVHPASGGAVNPYPLIKAIDACTNTTPRA